MVDDTTRLWLGRHNQDHITRVPQPDQLEQQLRERIAADLDRRADALSESIKKMKKGSREAAGAYIAAVAMRTAATHVRDRIEYHGGEAKSAVMC